MGRRKYVLIVDDCQQDRMAVADVLRSDYDILEACNGKQALEILSRKKSADFADYAGSDDACDGRL